MSYKRLSDRRKGQRVIYSSRLFPEINIQWRNWRCKNYPEVRLLPIVGTGLHLNHWVVYLYYEGIPTLVISAHFLESDAINVAAATEATLRGLTRRGWQPKNYLNQPGSSELARLIRLVLEDDAPEDELLVHFSSYSLLKNIKKLIKIRNAKN